MGANPGIGVVGGALVAAFADGLLLTPISPRTHMPFAAIGFTSVVSMMPGRLLFRMASAVVHVTNGSRTPDLLGGMVAAGVIAIVILALSFGLIIPKTVIDFPVARRRPDMERDENGRGPLGRTRDDGDSLPHVASTSGQLPCVRCGMSNHQASTGS